MPFLGLRLIVCLLSCSSQHVSSPSPSRAQSSFTTATACLAPCRAVCSMAQPHTWRSGCARKPACCVMSALRRRCSRRDTRTQPARCRRLLAFPRRRRAAGCAPANPRHMARPLHALPMFRQQQRRSDQKNTCDIRVSSPHACAWRLAPLRLHAHAGLLCACLRDLHVRRIARCVPASPRAAKRTDGRGPAQTPSRRLATGRTRLRCRCHRCGGRTKWCWCVARSGPRTAAAADASLRAGASRAEHVERGGAHPGQHRLLGADT